MKTFSFLFTLILSQPALSSEKDTELNQKYSRRARLANNCQEVFIETKKERLKRFIKSKRKSNKLLKLLIDEEAGKYE